MLINGCKILLMYFFFSNFQKVLSNSEDLKMKNWLIEETNNEDSEEINNSTEQVCIVFALSQQILFIFRLFFFRGCFFFG